MKFRVVLDDINGLDEGVANAVFLKGKDLSPQDSVPDEIISERSLKLEAFMGRWVDSTRYVTLEFDVDKNTAIVVPVGG